MVLQGDLFGVVGWFCDFVLWVTCIICFVSSAVLGFLANLFLGFGCGLGRGCS